MNIFWEQQVGILRHWDNLSEYENKYWSANKVIFNGQMKLRDTRMFRGKIAIVDFDEKHFIFDFGEYGIFVNDGNKQDGIRLGGVMEALFVGVEFPEVIRDFPKGILAPGSIANPNERDFFCPYLFPFGSEISIGIELLKKAKGNLALLPKNKVFILEENKP